MAKKNVGRLAGLAALAGAAYMASKGKDNDDAGDQKTSSYTGDKKKVEASGEDSTPRRQITDYIAKAPGESKPITEADVAMPEKAAPKKAAVSKVATPKVKTSKKVAASIGDSSRVNLEAGMSRGTRAAAAKNPDYSNEGRNAPAPAAKPDSAPTANVVKTSASTSKTEPYKHTMPGNALFQSIRERGNKDLEERNLKRGGKVKKMASGGMTASRRADGIASRGKTRCKMY